MSIFARFRGYPPLFRGARATHGEDSPYPGDPGILGKPGYRHAEIPLVPMTGVPMRERLEGNDYTNYSQPIPREFQFQSYWRGNQVPIATIQTTAHPYWIHFRTLDQVVPQQKQGSFNLTLGQQQSASIIERWHQLWQSQS